MVKRKCGTCRYFRDAQIACSGWCTHPERGDLHDLVLVRSEELACRNSWDNDLWEQARQAPAKSPIASQSPPGPARPQVPDNPTDRVTSIDIARPAGASDPSERRSPHPAVAGGQESRPRAQIEVSNREARASAARPPGSGVSSLEPSFSRALPGPRSTGRPAAEVAVNTTESPVIVRADRRDPQPPAPAIVADRGPGATLAPEDTSPLPVEEVNRVLERVAKQRPAQRQRTLPDVQAPAIEHLPGSPFVHIDGLDREASATRDAFAAPATAPGPASPSGISPLDESAWVAGIPRCCDTCREFRRDPSGKQGYCGSPYAFASRTMVKSDQLACRSSFAVWWLPNDDIWLEKADISHHTRPTPYLDAILDDLRPETR